MHMCPCQHCAALSTASVLHMHFLWSTLSVDIDTFVRDCIDFYLASGGGMCCILSFSLLIARFY